jgi:hypothetical protein
MELAKSLPSLFAYYSKPLECQSVSAHKLKVCLLLKPDALLNGRYGTLSLITVPI